MTDVIHEIESEALAASTGRAWVKPAIYGVGALLLLILVYVVVYRLFFQGQDLARARGNNVVAGEQAKANDNIVNATMGAAKDSQQEQQRVNVVVTDARSKIDDGWHGETVGADVDRAGADALCKLHDSLCRLPPSPEVQPVHGAVSGGDPGRGAASGRQ